MISKMTRIASMCIAVGLVLDAPASAQDKPMVFNRIPDQTAPEDQPFTFTVSPDTFRDPDDDPEDLTITIRKLDDADWLRVNQTTLSLSGTPDAFATPPIVRMRVTASDPAAQSIGERVRRDHRAVEQTGRSGSIRPASQ